MGVRVTVGSGEQHPLGWFAFKILDSEGATGKFGAQIKFTLKSTQKDEAGQPFKMNFYTSTVCNPNTHLGKLFAACEMELPVGMDLDTDVLEGEVIEGKVEMNKAGTFANVVEVRARVASNVKPAPAPPPPPPTEADFNDPFADE